MAAKTRYQSFTDRMFDVGTLRKNQKEKFGSLLLSGLEPLGFSKVTRCFNGERKSTMVTRFERIDEIHDTCDWIEIAYDKYNGRKFQVWMGKTDAQAPYDNIRNANLVKKPDQYVYAWGARAWLPFRDLAFDRACNRVLTLIPQMNTYLETGTFGPNISKHDLL